MQARESVLNSEAIGNIKDISPIVQPDMSDSASLDNVFEFFVMSGLSLPHALTLLVPESFNDKNPISEDLKAFYEYYSILMDSFIPALDKLGETAIFSSQTLFPFLHELITGLVKRGDIELEH